MLTYVTRQAHWLDVWLRRKLGRPYVALLAIGLGLGISETLRELGKVIADGEKGLESNILKTVALVVFQSALLINQLAQLDQHRERRRRRRMRAQGKARVAGAGAER